MDCSVLYFVGPPTAATGVRQRLRTGSTRTTGDAATTSTPIQQWRPANYQCASRRAVIGLKWSKRLEQSHRFLNRSSTPDVILRSTVNTVNPACPPTFQAPGKALAHALLLWLYPVSFFFSFLFYTDPGATFFVLLCYLLATGRPRGGGWGRRFGSSLVSRAGRLVGVKSLSLCFLLGLRWVTAAHCCIRCWIVLRNYPRCSVSQGSRCAKNDSNVVRDKIRSSALPVSFETAIVRSAPPPY